MAIDRRGGGPAILHSDQGSTYSTAEHRALLGQHAIRQSMSRKADCWDNASIESFFHTLKTELVMHCDYQPQFRLGPACSITWRCSTTASGAIQRFATRLRWPSKHQPSPNPGVHRSWGGSRQVLPALQRLRHSLPARRAAGPASINPDQLGSRRAILSGF